jgi:hypothetical protein
MKGDIIACSGLFVMTMPETTGVRHADRCEAHVARGIAVIRAS